MIQLLIVLAILGFIYFAVLGGNTKKIEQKPPAPYQQEIQQFKGLEQSMLQSADRRARDIDQQVDQDR